MNLPDPAWMARQWQIKRDWHAQQRTQPFHAKVQTVIVLQKRQASVNIGKRALGLPEIPMRVWGER